jgi:hypothetical protein
VSGPIPQLPIKLDEGSFGSLPHRLVLGTALVAEILRITVEQQDRLFIINGPSPLRVSLSPALTFTDLLSRYSPLIDTHALPSYDSASFPPVP